ncbi:MAG: hypothetical protein HW416_71 [Chloroflexi bacterium]|nr:hypothetical protein [Chloroflexota bacterium]
MSLQSPNDQASRVGEVIGTAISTFQGQCLRLHESPPLGALVRVRAETDLTIYGIVVGAFTDGLDVGARPIPRAADGMEDAEVYHNHPDLALVLRTCFDCLVVGFDDNAGIHQHLPPTPPPIHYSIGMGSSDEVRGFTRTLDYFRMLLGERSLPTEEVLAAHIRCAATARERTVADETAYAFRVRAGREVAALLRDDHQRLITVLQRIRPTAVDERPRARLVGETR